MSDQPAPNVGARIRSLRERQGLSLRVLAKRCGLSVNAISRIERGENSPTVSSLHMLASALGVPITRFFEETHEQSIVFVKHDIRMRTQVNGMVLESLGIGLRNQQLEPFYVTIQPHVGDIDAFVSHPGQEFAHCLRGQIEYRVGEETYLLEPGDSLLFEANQPHYFSNPGEKLASMLLVFQAMEGGHVARRRHLEA
jgi:transcriptional regulator with XRE-family HTH domain